VRVRVGEELCRAVPDELGDLGPGVALRVSSETFLPVEISSGFEFEDWVTLWEWDFRPTSLRHTWEWTTNIPADALDTELGGEEIRAQVFIRNVTLGSAPIHRHTPILQISPD
jgi:hypothetical protein